MTKRTAVLIARLHDLAATGETATEMGRQLGVSHLTITNWGRLAGIRLPNLSEAQKRIWADPEKRRRMSHARKSEPSKLMIPKWVPRDLRDDYRDIAVMNGEEVAASRVRRMKRAAVSEALGVR